MIYSLHYAAPEVVHAVEAGSRTIYVDAAVDMWAIGVIAFELLTSTRIFPVHVFEDCEGEQRARDALMGRTPLPWEGQGASVEGKLVQLRGLRRGVMRCLDRKASARPSAEELLSSWEHAFDNMQTRGSTRSAGTGQSTNSYTTVH